MGSGLQPDKAFTQTSCTESTASNYDASRIPILKDYNAAIKEVKEGSYVILEHFCDSKEENELAAHGRTMAYALIMLIVSRLWDMLKIVLLAAFMRKHLHG